MKMITAIIKPLKFNDVKTALEDFGIKGMTVIGVRGFGAQGGHTEIFRGAEYKIELIEKIKLEICVKADQVEKVIEIILENARSGPNGEIGDGKIFVTNIEEVLRIRTGERGEIAL